MGTDLRDIKKELDENARKIQNLFDKDSEIMQLIGELGISVGQTALGSSGDFT